ncbi:MAG: hypothetical protein CMF48_00565 [Legionellales bacterium]|nr:hypothetical protein [Legionellales bacterium]
MLGLLATLVQSADAQTVWRQQAPDGSTEFTDKAVPGATQKTLTPAPSYTRTPSGRWDARQTNSPSTSEITQYRTNIQQPTDGTVFLHDDNEVVIRASVVPALSSEHQFQLVLNGEAVGEPNRDGVFILKNLYRGEYTVRVQIINKKGRVIKQSHSPSIQFTQKRWRAS